METVPTAQVQAQLMESSAEFRELAEKHSSYDRRIEELGSRRFPSQEEQIEEARLKKIKLHLKDQMHSMLREHLELATT